MQRREKIMLFALVAVILGAQGFPLVKRVVFAPLADRHAQIKRLDASLEVKTHEQLEIHRSRKKLRDWTALSLPPDVPTAQRLYQEWLTDLAQVVGFQQLKVTSARRVRSDKVFTPVRVSIETKATFEQLCTFLYRFHRAGLLHRIANLTADSDSSTGKALLTVSLILEGLSLPDAPKRDRLFPQTELKEQVSTSATDVTPVSMDGFPPEGGFPVRIGNEYLLVTEVSGATWKVQRAADSTSAADHQAGDSVELVRIHRALQDRTLKDYQAILEKNPFVKPVKEIVASTEVQELPKPAGDDVAQKTLLTGTTAQDEQWQALLFDQSTNKRTVIRKGTTVAVADIKAIVLEIGHNFVLLRSGDETWLLELGKSLRSMKKQTATPAVEDPPLQLK